MKRFFKKLSVVVAAAISLSCIPFTTFGTSVAAYDNDDDYYLDKNNIIYTQSFENKPSFGNDDELVVYKNGCSHIIYEKNYTLMLDVENNAVIMKNNLDLPKNYKLQYGKLEYSTDTSEHCEWYIKAENEDEFIQLAKMSQKWVNNGIIKEAYAYRVFPYVCYGECLEITLDSADENFLNRLNEIQKSVDKPEYNTSQNTTCQKVSDTKYKVYSDVLTVREMKEVLDSEENVKEILNQGSWCEVLHALISYQTASEFVRDNDNAVANPTEPIVTTTYRPTEPIFADYSAKVEFDNSPMKVGEKRKVRVWNPETGKTSGITFPVEMPSEISVEYEEGSDTFYITALATGKVSLEIWEKSCPFTNRLNFTIEDGANPTTTVATSVSENVTHPTTLTSAAPIQTATNVSCITMVSDYHTTVLYPNTQTYPVSTTNNLMAGVLLEDNNLLNVDDIVINAGGTAKIEFSIPRELKSYESCVGQICLPDGLSCEYMTVNREDAVYEVCRDDSRNEYNFRMPCSKVTLVIKADENMKAGKYSAKGQGYYTYSIPISSDPYLFKSGGYVYQNKNINITVNDDKNIGMVSPTNINHDLVSKYGDANSDENVNIADVVKLNMYLLNSDYNALDDVQLANSDCVADGVINANDSTAIMNYVAMITPFDSLGKYSLKN